MEKGEKDYQDKGYAWVVCFCSSLSRAICEGVGTAFGVLVPEIQRVLQNGMASTTLMGSLHFGVAFILGPLYMLMGKQFGSKITGMAGTFILAMGILACGVKITTLNLIIFYGVV